MKYTFIVFAKIYHNNIDKIVAQNDLLKKMYLLVNMTRGRIYRIYILS